MAIRFPTPFIASFGEEDFFLDRDYNQFRDQPNRTVVALDGLTISDEELVSICSTMVVDLDDPAASKPRIVVVDNAQKLKADKALKAYAESKTKKDLDCVLALIVRSEKLASSWVKLGDKITVREFKKLKTWDNNNEVVKWIQEEADSLKLKVDQRIAGAMFSIAGADLYRLSSELRKLSILVGSGTVTENHLKAVMVPGSTVEPWTVAEAAFEKNVKKALNAISQLFRYSSDEPAIPVLYALMKQAEKLFVTRNLLDRGLSEDDVAGRLGMHPYRFKMSLLPLAGKHTTSSLSRLMQNLCRLDVELKRTSQSKRTLLELAVIDLAS